MSIFEAGRVAIALFAVVLLTPSPRSYAEDPCDQIPKLLASAEKIRDLPSSSPVKCRSLPSKEYQREVSALLSEQNREDDLKKEEHLFKILGFIPEEYPYAWCMLHGSNDSSYAFYNRRSKEVILRSDAATPPSFIVHELVHALQDQRYNLSRLRESVLSTDGILARSALIEGDAIAAEEEFRRQNPEERGELEGEGYDQKCTPEEPLKSILLFPYEWGGFFFVTLSRNTAPEIREFPFKHPPNSTKEILYPFTYPKDRPKGTKINHSTKSRYVDSLGEFMIRSLLKRYVDPKRAILAAKGWRGDVVTLIEADINHQIVYTAKWHIEFEKAKDGDEFIEALGVAISKRFAIPLLKATRWSAEITPKQRITASLKENLVDIEFTFGSGT